MTPRRADTGERVGPVALVTGASRGIGRAIAVELARRGFSVAVAARDAADLRETARMVTDCGGRALVVRCDVARASDVSRALKRCGAEFGHLDVLVNNAGAGRFASIDETDPALWDATISCNLTGAYLVTRAALPLLRGAGSPVILNIASIAAIRPFVKMAAYAASKAGLLAFSRVLREELRPEGIRVAVLLPGATSSHFWDTAGVDWDQARMMNPARVAAMAADIVMQPPDMLTEEVIVMPSGGAM